jgi:nitrite reductase/ring-hydroxylating ferredoxin subunit
LPQLAGGGLLVKEVAGEPVLFLKVGEDFFAYRTSARAAAHRSRAGGLERDELDCPGCGRCYDVRRAGRCLDDSGLHLEPIPLLADAVDVQERQGSGRRSMVKIALPDAVG